MLMGESLDTEHAKILIWFSKALNCSKLSNFSNWFAFQTQQIF